ncbi:S-adenosylmethionine decarboxylase proenzyme [Snodgrassella alvi]|jgi:S-adenosylmethionine decarboxylase|uniref:adenosylmethionine decarboxylase n=1 Tax=Snodgrassella alvi TaxID=1196083 RepID=UPI000C1DD5D9|nr:adenosylmethionine decarboxylase [Snodgrassella alvi]PIT10449.1 S-adenosylmethionine decarboxylase proenzyme [Snodgrassella alvi]PIT58394.1 S-adenosylmethionine decarboxylase proenzyme [Snodgrassella alvi]
MQFNHAIGQHCLLDVYQLNSNWLQDAIAIEKALLQVAQVAQAHILASHFHTFGGSGGVTGVLLLAESHISIHTWPEHHYAAIDIFMCGKLLVEAAVAELQQVLPNAQMQIRWLAREYVPIA